GLTTRMWTSASKSASRICRSAEVSTSSEIRPSPRRLRKTSWSLFWRPSNIAIVKPPAGTRIVPGPSEERKRLLPSLAPFLGIRALDLGEVGLFEVRLDGIAGDGLSRPGDGPHFEALQAADAGGDPVAVAEGRQLGVRDESGEDPAAGESEEVLGRAVEAEPAAVEQEDARGRGLDVARDVGREEDDAVRRLLEEDLAEAPARFDV